VLVTERAILETGALLAVSLTFLTLAFLKIITWLALKTVCSLNVTVRTRIFLTWPAETFFDSTYFSKAVTKAALFTLVLSFTNRTSVGLLVAVAIHALVQNW